MNKKMLSLVAMVSISLFSAVGHAYYLEESASFYESSTLVEGIIGVYSINVYSYPANNEEYAVIKLTAHNSESSSVYAVYLHDLSDSTSAGLFEAFQNMKLNGGHVVLLRNDTQSSVVTQSSWHGITKIFHVYSGDKVELWSSN